MAHESPGFPGYRNSVVYPNIYTSWMGEYIITHPKTGVVLNCDTTLLSPARWLSHRINARTLLRDAHIASWTPVVTDPRLCPLSSSAAGWSPRHIRTAIPPPEYTAYSIPDSFVATSEGITYASLAFRNPYHLLGFHNMYMLDKFINGIPVGSVIEYTPLSELWVDTYRTPVRALRYWVNSEQGVGYGCNITTYQSSTPPAIFTALPGDLVLPPGETDYTYLTSPSSANLLDFALSKTLVNDEAMWAMQEDLVRKHIPPTPKSPHQLETPSSIIPIVHSTAPKSPSPPSPRNGVSVIAVPMNKVFANYPQLATWLGISVVQARRHVLHPRPRIYYRHSERSVAPITLYPYSG